MTYVAKDSPRYLGFDTISYLTPWAVKLHDALGIRTAFRYIRRDRHVNDRPDLSDYACSLSKRELAELVNVFVSINTVQFGIGTRWLPEVGTNAEKAFDYGIEVGSNAAWNQRELEAPLGTGTFCDCEWMADIPKKAARLAYLNGWSMGYVDESQGDYEPRLYVDVSLGLTSAELYQLPRFKKYWKSASKVPSVDTRGYAVVQTLEIWFDGSTVRPWDNSFYGQRGIRGDLDVVACDKFSWLKGIGT